MTFSPDFYQQGFENPRTELHFKYVVINNIKGILGDSFTFDTSESML